MGKSNPKVKSFDISKRLVWEAYKSVKANQGAAGVDGTAGARHPHGRPRSRTGTATSPGR